MTVEELNIDKIEFPDTQYYNEKFTKSQVYLHHTAGGANPRAVFTDWASSDVRVATAFVIGGVPSKSGTWIDGRIVQGFSSALWAYHLGLKTTVFSDAGVPYRALDKISIGIEICNWGYVTETDKGWETYVGTVIPESQVCELSTPHRGYKHYHKYTDAQIESVRKLVIFLGEKYSIPTKYNPDIFDLTNRALTGESGVFTHNSVRKDKVDIFPQPEMVQMLQSL